MEQRLEQLLSLCERLREENRVLRESQSQLATERASLLERNEQARARIEGMIGRLRAMEQQ
ncbi:TIGR02449 family protein [Alkalilimnicola sp. S0819]|uniref:TIGR02449 family protein n=1 Tax=Alkalilimnicola sp. S0819 TaxID=2613922 RepID=UPI0012627534|nr:TIGR02449 family protein [Alkalilimnicola sp. S0819]KAB7628207.1 TIGR02449 family protein [Alkalilimnicola sp. S0819]MPQ15098.1 TIGR02449 family protein [Alkalilimnicola sp. S0819]